jgi:hypothetical protein
VNIKDINDNAPLIDPPNKTEFIREGRNGAILLLKVEDADLVSENNFINSGLYRVLPALPSQWFLMPARLYPYQPLLQTVQIPDVSSKEGAVIGAVLDTRKFHH